MASVYLCAIMRAKYSAGTSEASVTSMDTPPRKCAMQRTSVSQKTVSGWIRINAGIAPCTAKSPARSGV